MKRISRRRFVSAASIAGAGLLAPAASRVENSLHAAPTLPLRPLGSTGAQVTLLGLGGGSRFYEPVPDDEQGAELGATGHRAGDRGHRDSRQLRPGNESERRIGMAMKTHRSRVFLETKVDARDYDGALREMERSLKLLQTDRIDLMLHHNVTRAEDLTRYFPKKERKRRSAGW